jgi:hypothetical protein
LAKRLLVFSAFLLFTAFVAGDLFAEGIPRFFVSSISPDLEIVTQVSNTTPHAWQQFSVIYSLRALRAPSAVDVDPQQYAGFWTELAPLPEQPRSTIRLQNGRQVSEYLLRQVIAFPMSAGSLELPPLRVKVKNASPKADTSHDWDVIGTSNPVSLTVKSLPSADSHHSIAPLVGELEGSLFEDSAGTRSELILELKGTANLALIQPEQWLKAPGDILFSIHLKDSDDTIQTLDTGDSRQLSLLQRRRWSIRLRGIPAKGVRIEDLAIPVFKPGQEHWTWAQIRGLELKRTSAPWLLTDSETDIARDHNRRLGRKALPAIIVSALFVFLVLFLLTQWFFHREKPR